MRLTVSLFVSLSLLALAAGCEPGKASGGKANGGTAAGENTTPAPDANAVPAATVASASGAAATLSTDAKAVKLTPENTKIEWVGSKNEGKHNGGFKQFEGTIDLKGDDPATARVAIAISIDSLYSDDQKLTGHLKSPDFFDVKAHPKATFVSTAIKSSTVSGDLTLHGVTKSITFPATISASGDTATLNSEFSINRQDFGMTFGAGKVHDQVVIKLSVKAPRK